MEFFGVLGKEAGDKMMRDYWRIRKEQIKLTMQRLQ